MRSRLPVGALTCCAALGFAAPAGHAASCQGRPGSAAIDQYCESIPSANGRAQSKQDVDDKARSTGGKRLGDVTRATVSKLQAAGPDGATALGLVAADPTPKAATKTSRSSRRAPSRRTPVAPVATAASVSAPSDNPVTALSKSLGGIGGVVWVLLGLGVGAALWRLRA